jgi:prolipoprotein diacylglyceryl transferase
MEWAYLPSPSISVISLGPLTVHFYALCIIAGIIVAVWWGERRFVARGGEPGIVTDVAYWAIPAGIVGGRLYHLATSWNTERSFLDAIAIWRGGLGIWGAISLGAFGAYLRYRYLDAQREKRVEEKSSKLPSFSIFMDSLAPGIVLAQAIGRWGNWFNIELFGRPTNLPWALEVPVENRPAGYSLSQFFHPTFLYESIWCVLIAMLCAYASRKSEAPRLAPGGTFALYVAVYSVGRLWIETLRIDESEELFGLRFNIWVSLLISLAATVLCVRSWRQAKDVAR